MAEFLGPRNGGGKRPASREKVAMNMMRPYGVYVSDKLFAGAPELTAAPYWGDVR
jgi:hypothetical protein